MPPLVHPKFLVLVALVVWPLRSTAQDAPEAQREPGAHVRREAGDLVERYLRAEGLDQPAGEMFPRASVHELSVGGSSAITKIRFLRDEKRNFRVEVEPPAGKPHMECSPSLGTVWIVGEAFGVGANSEPSELVKALFRLRTGRDFLREKYRSHRRVPGWKIDGKLHDVVAMLRHDGDTDYWCFDVDTGALARIECPMEATQPGMAAFDYSEFHVIDGVLEPMLMSTGEGAGRVMVRTISVRNGVNVKRGGLGAFMGVSAGGGDFDLPAEPQAMWNTTSEIMAKYVKAAGGSLNLAKILSRVTKSKCELTTTGVKFTMVISQKLPDWVVVENDVPGIGKSWQGYNGRTGWLSSELQGFRTLRGDELQLFIRSSDLHNTGEFGKMFNVRNLLGSKTIDGRAVLVVALANKVGAAGVHYFEVETGQLARVESVLALAGGGNMPVTIDFSDYRTVDGITLPFTTIVTNPAMRMVTTVESVQHNLELDDALFQPRKEP